MKNIYNNHKDIGLFNNGDYLVFSFKKTEKIVSALYLVTGLLKDNEPMKWELREGGMSLLSILMTLNGPEAVDKNRLLQSFFSSSIQIISFLNISFVSGLVSEMNSSILVHEITSLVDYLKHNSISQAHPSGFILSDSFFAVDHSIHSPQDSSKGHITAPKSNQTNKGNDLMIKDKKDSRKNAIVGLLKKDSKLTIKDFVKVIADCSEKTIQRELIDLVEKGIVKKEGERRWSTYSLA